MLYPSQERQSASKIAYCWLVGSNADHHVGTRPPTLCIVHTMYIVVDSARVDKVGFRLDLDLGEKPLRPTASRLKHGASKNVSLAQQKRTPMVPCAATNDSSMVFTTNNLPTKHAYNCTWYTHQALCAYLSICIPLCCAISTSLAAWQP